MTGTAAAVEGAGSVRRSDRVETHLDQVGAFDGVSRRARISVMVRPVTATHTRELAIKMRKASSAGAEEA